MNFKEGETLLVDKPLGWTSFDVVNKIRWALKQNLNVKKIKVGHAGTLDPLATGLLIICTGKNTKQIERLSAEKKGYTGSFLLGRTTPSFDLETEYNKDFPIHHIDKEAINKVKNQFIGCLKQKPPLFSAKQINGKRAYEYARKGIQIDLKENDIVIDKFELDSDDFPKINFKIICSKGTYIRSLANDFGLALKSGATLIELRRTTSGTHSIEQAKSIEEWIEIIKKINT